MTSKKSHASKTALLYDKTLEIVALANLGEEPEGDRKFKVPESSLAFI
jgi:hypothetical protein